jgi:hypothetical protein
MTSSTFKNSPNTTLAWGVIVFNCFLLLSAGGMTKTGMEARTPKSYGMV